jgi:acetylornithine deacetylase/succinyl-diaminopimelate desuccinylase-like protein
MRHLVKEYKKPVVSALKRHGGGAPVVYAERIGRSPKLLFYSHYDVHQPGVEL